MQQRATISAWEAAALVALTFAALITVGVQLAGMALPAPSRASSAAWSCRRSFFVRVSRVPPSRSASRACRSLATPVARSSAAAPSTSSPSRCTPGSSASGRRRPSCAMRCTAWSSRQAARARSSSTSLALALVPAAAEELMFRGVALRRGAPAASAPTPPSSPPRSPSASITDRSTASLPAAFGGLLLGGVRAASGSLWPALAFHAANNAGRHRRPAPRLRDAAGDDARDRRGCDRDADRLHTARPAPNHRAVQRRRPS